MGSSNSSEPTFEDYRRLYEEWQSQYKSDQWLDKTDENWVIVQKIDPRLVWTAHSTCEDEMVSNGAHLYENSCCWTTFGWHIAEKPWPGAEDEYLTVNTTLYLPCSICNPDGEDEEDYDSECLECEGEGYVNHYFD